MLNYDPDKSLGYLSGLSSRLLSNRLAKRFREAGIDMTPEQWGAIIILINGDALTQGQLGERLFLEKSSISRLLDGLERRGWIVRTKARDDTRNKRVSPTEEAKSIAEKCASIARSVLEEAQQGLSDDEVRLCLSLLRRVIGNLR
jgi:DNA-binding MarR family transcriptional regulator